MRKAISSFQTKGITMGFTATRKWIAAGAVALTAIGLAGCSGGPASGEAETKIADYMTMSEADLVVAAEAEGTLTLYSGRGEAAVRRDIEAFEAKYDIDVELYRAANDEVRTRTLKEFKANRPTADIVDVTAPEMLDIDAEAALAPYTAAPSDDVIDDARFGNWTAARFVVFAPAWNTNNVSAEEAPKSWEELADPKWKGRIGVELTDYEWYYALWHWFTEEDGKSEGEADQLMKDIIDNSVIVKGHSAAAELLAAGQFDVFATPYLDIVETLKQSGSPVEYAPVTEPLIVKASGSGILANAPHPAAAVLWNNWLLGEGQETVASGGVLVAVESFQTDELAGKEVYPVDAEALRDVSDEWSQRFENLTAGKPVSE